MLELWAMFCTPIMQLLPCALYPRVETADWILSLGQIEMLDHLTLYKQNIDV